jgi:hypothetical protein
MTGLANKGISFLIPLMFTPNFFWGRRGHDRTVHEFTTICHH